MSSVFLIAIQGGEGLSAMNGTWKIKVSEWQKKKKRIEKWKNTEKNKRIDSIQRREVGSLFPIIHSTTIHESKSFKIQRALIKLGKFWF